MLYTDDSSSKFSFWRTASIVGLLRFGDNDLLRKSTNFCNVSHRFVITMAVEKSICVWSLENCNDWLLSAELNANSAVIRGVCWLNFFTTSMPSWWSMKTVTWLKLWIQKSLAQYELTIHLLNYYMKFSSNITELQ